jgi:hypothetical protein
MGLFRYKISPMADKLRISDKIRSGGRWVEIVVLSVAEEKVPTMVDVTVSNRWGEERLRFYAKDIVACKRKRL